MTVDAVASTGIYTTTPVRTPKQEMDGEVFLNLLVTQLRNQDPSSPMDSNEMISQTSQLAMMEKLTAISTTSDQALLLQLRATAAALVGKNVGFTRSDGTTGSGVATAVSYTSSVPTLTIDGESVALDAVSGVTSASHTD